MLNLLGLQQNSKTLSHIEKPVADLIENFNKEGEIIYDGGRNVLKTFNLNGDKVIIKAFKIPHLLNRVVYRYFRKSKAARSFEHAQRLLSAGIGTPEPLGYLENKTPFGLYKSYYVSRHIDYNLTFRELFENPKYIGNNQILKAFTAFTFKLHENNIHFLDHSPGNTLIKINDSGYQFFLVDLNRMRFEPMDFKKRISNFSRLTPKKEMVEVMAKEYARLANYDEELTVTEMWKSTQDFQEKFYRKKRLKKQLKFWKK